MLATAVRRWAVLAVALPLAAAGIRKVTQVVEARRGSSGLTRSMRQVADLLGSGRKRRRRFF
ncbi:hypothetical protein SAMN05421812_11238 [Asanoa hainanensis]|uniref:Uncharacterized protein n=1 Tax=Asanoa hainanensis TaxID=560556 RepID=A0A239NZR7_9ACTN|nr:hypothetical protein [Asanoa hainanensis]SNT60212.1 hypothetical protein SAMN05421812_11238 [Asanoa hainanensis]